MKSTRQILKVVLIALVAFTAAVGLAQTKSETEAYERLLKYKYRPTVTEFLAEFDGKIPSVEMFQDDRREVIAAAGPKMIAALEFIYPNGIYASLGRDSFLMANIIEAFYFRYGESDRTAYLHASGETVENLVKKHKILSFLKSNGFGDPARPFVIMDRTSMGEGSQSTLLYGAAYKSLKRRGLSDRKIVQLIGVATTHKGVSAKKMSEFPTEKRIGIPLALGDIDGVEELPDVGYWTESYGPILSATSTQPMRGKITESFGREEKVQVLNLIYDSIVVTANPEFLKKVKAAADKFGYSFVSRISKKAVVAAEIEFIRKAAEQKAIVERAEKINALSKRMTRLLLSKKLVVPRAMHKLVGVSQKYFLVGPVSSVMANSPIVADFTAKMSEQISAKTSADEINKMAVIFSQELRGTFVDKVAVAVGGQGSNKDLSGFPFYVALLGKVGEHKSYLSENGLAVVTYLDNVAKLSNLNTAINGLVFKTLFVAKAEKKIDAKDLRRIIMGLISKFSKANEIKQLANIVSGDNQLNDFLSANGEIIAASKRFEGTAGQALRQLIKLKVVSKSALKTNCKTFLTAEIEDNGYFN